MTTRTPTRRSILIAIVIAFLSIAITPRVFSQSSTPTSQPSPEQASSESFLQLLLKGGWAIAPIGAASFLGLALIIERFIALRRSRILPRKFIKRLESLDRDRDKALAVAKESDTSAARVALAGLLRIPAGLAAAERAMEETGAREVQRLRKNIRLLYGVSAVSPMLGLLGTVIGMIEAFRVASLSRGLGKPELLATGIYEALVCTMAGLMVCIPTLLAYYYFITRIETSVGDLNDTANTILHQFVFTQETPARPTTTARPPVPLPPTFATAREG